MYTRYEILNRLATLKVCETGWEAAKETEPDLLIEFVTKLETDIPAAIRLARGHEYEKLAPWLIGRWCEPHSLKGANLKGLDLRGAKLDNADLSGADLEECYLFQTTFLYANLKGTNLRKALGQSARLEHCTLTGADLSYAFLRYARFNRSDITDAKLIGSNLTGADFRLAFGRQEANFSKATTTAMEW